ncbi:MipA/OmpV family protein [Corticibacterium sp. UT-5YL-CI-8]|nr:MipA/OmpV family protein [Tianweitania sp. UT-5YL-CI-8]
MSIVRYSAAVSLAALMMAPAAASAETFDWIAGEWSLELGATGMIAPGFEGSKKYKFTAIPVFSLGKSGNDTRFSSRNDSISFALIDDGNIRVGLAGQFLWKEEFDGIDGLDPVRWGGEVGGFFEFYPLDWMRARAELRHGIRAHNGFVADFSADAFKDVTPDIRISAGPRVSLASADFFDTYFGITAEESQRSGVSEYNPGGGIRSAGVGGAISWKATDNITASLFGEYSRLMGPAADSTIVQERGSRDQFTIGLSTSYRFDFRL